MTNQEIRQRLQFLLPSGLTDSEWAAITSKVADFVREEIMAVLPEEKTEKDDFPETDRENFGFNNCRFQILAKLKERGRYELGKLD